MEEEDLEKFSLLSWKHSLLSFILSMRKLRPRGEVTCLESPSWLVTEKGWDLSRVPASLILGLSWERLLFFAALSLSPQSVWTGQLRRDWEIEDLPVLEHSLTGCCFPHWSVLSDCCCLRHPQAGRRAGEPFYFLRTIPQPQALSQISIW